MTNNDDSRLTATAPLGADGPQVGVQGLGCMGMSFAYGPTDADEARATLERALELGVTLYDTADAYGDGEMGEQDMAPLEPIAARVAGPRYADMRVASAGRE